MREPVRDAGRLDHIQDAIHNVETFTAGLTKEELEKDVLHLHAVIFNIQVIGEAVYKLSPEFKVSHPSTPWPLIEKMRHILVHDYYRIDPDILWDIIQNDLPVLKEQIEAIRNE
jgi:uncharacterized protein with HEPN domain